MLDGAKSLVLHGDSADKFIVSARLAGGQRDRNGIGFFWSTPARTGVAVRGYGTVDGLRAAEVTLTGVRVDAATAIGEPGAAFPLIERVADAAMAALCRRSRRRHDGDAGNHRRIHEDAQSSSASPSAASRPCSIARPTC